MKRQRRGPSIALLLVGVNIVVLLLPIAAIALYRIYDLYLLRQTERQLIAQSVVVAERFSTDFGRAQIILKTDGGYIGGSEWRTDGQAVGF